MTLTLLLDLDDTLLTTRIDSFIAAYLNLLGKFLSQQISIEAEAIIHHLLAATEQMIRNDRPDRTLEETFDDAFYPALGIPRTDLQGTIDRFYSELFPSLKALTTPRPEAIQLVEQAFRRGFQVVVATNPLFPRTAIVQRLEWAGLSPGRCPFELITSYENFHYTKPNPAFYAEILAQLGWPDQPAVMVGNHPDADIQPALSAGIATFWISSDFPGDKNQTIKTASGSLIDLIRWLDQVELQDLQPNFSSPSSVTASLQAAPAGLPALINRIPVSLRGERPAPEEWSLVEILCHLRDVEREVHLPRLEKILREDNPFLPNIDSDIWAVERGYRSSNPTRAFQEFVQARKETLSRIHALPASAWDRPSRHAIFGPTRLDELMSFAADHDRIHLRQVKQIERSFTEGIKQAKTRALRSA